MQRRTVLRGGLGLAIAAALGPDAMAQVQAGRWRRARTDVFDVYSPVSDERVQVFAQALTEFDRLLRFLLQETGAPSPRRLSVYMLDDRGDFAEAYGPAPSADIGGWYQSGLYETAAIGMSRSYRGANLYEVLFHEYTHHFMFHYSPLAYPIWYAEGFAEFVGTATFQDDVIVVGLFNASRAYWLTNSGWLPMDVFLRTPPWRLNSIGVAVYYAQAWLTSHFLMLNAERQAGFIRYVTALRSGADPVEGFEPAFGVSTEDFYQELRDYARRRIPFITLPRATTAGAAAMEITRLPRSADTLLHLAPRIEHTTEEDDRRALLTEIRTRAARYDADDPLAVRIALRARIELGDPAAAEADALALAAAEPDDAEAQYLAGRCLLQQAQAAEGAPDSTLLARARPFFVRANRLRPDHPATLHGYVSTFRTAPLTPEVLDVLVQAHLLAPETEELALETAQALLEAGRTDEAMELAQRLAFSPHAGRVGQEGLALYERIRAGGEAPAEPPPEDPAPVTLDAPL